MAIVTHPAPSRKVTDKPAEQQAAARYSFNERITWKTPLRGLIPHTEKDAADHLAVGGLRDAADSVGRLNN